MGLRSTLRLVEALEAPASRPHPQIGSPWVTGALTQIVVSDLYGLDLPVSRAEAMTVPAIARARHIVVTTIARMPLTVYKGPDPVPDQPYWAYRTNDPTGQSPQLRMARTIDDLIFYGDALWLVIPPRLSADGRPSAMAHVPYDSWAYDVDDGWTIDQKPVPDECGRCEQPQSDDIHRRADADGGHVYLGPVVYISGLHEGILSFGQRTIRQAVRLERRAVDAAERPFRVEMHQTVEEEVTEAEIRLIVSEARTAMAENGGVLWTSAGVEARVHQTSGDELLITGRNASAVDCARIVGVPAATVDATSAGSSLTYETTQGRNAELVDYGLAAYMTPVSARLSMDDVVPRGHRVAFELEEITGSAVPMSTGQGVVD